MVAADRRLVPWPVIRRALRALTPSLDDVQRRAQRAPASPDLRARQREYVAGCGHKDVRKALEWLVAGKRGWAFVSFASFMEATLRSFDSAVDGIVAHLAIDREAACCLCIDSFWKSSFWMCALLLNHLQTRAGAQPALRRLYLMVESGEGAVAECMASLPAGTMLVFVDDAAYSGRQLTEYMNTVTNALDNKPRGTQRARHLAVVPFVSDVALALMRQVHGVSPIYSQRFKGLLSKRYARDVMAADVLLLPRDRSDDVQAAQSLFFDFLKLEPYHTATIFEHKIPDAISVPSLWLHVGPVPLPADYNVRAWNPDLLPDIMARAETLILKREPSCKDYFRAARDTLALLPATAGPPGRYLSSPGSPGSAREARKGTSSSVRRLLPILPLDICDAGYVASFRDLETRGVQLWEAGGDPVSVLRAVAQAQASMPDCFTPPYKHVTLQASIKGLVASHTTV